MNPEPINQAILNAINQVLGIEAEEITLETDFQLDLNATPNELEDIKESIETQLDIQLPALDAQNSITVGDLQTLVDDSLL